VENTKRQVKKIILEILKHEWNVFDNAHTANSIIDGYVDKVDALYIPVGFKPKEATFVPDTYVPFTKDDKMVELDHAEAQRSSTT
jgi:hypothetical protein